MKYWIIKGNPGANDWDSMLIPGQVEFWHTGRVPKGWNYGDRIFCWESTPSLRIVGLAELLETDCGVDEISDLKFRVKYLTKRLSSMPGIQELRSIPILNTASFLKSGPATTLFPLTFEQADILFRLLHARNGELKSIWPDLNTISHSEIIPDLEPHLQLQSTGSCKHRLNILTRITNR